MNPDAIALIRDSWARIGPDAPRLADGFYQHLVSIDEETTRLFTQPDALVLREKFITRLTLIVSALDEPELLVPLLASIGTRHQEAGMGARHYVLMGEALLSALRTVLGAEWNPALYLAWADTYTFLSSIMKRAGARASGAHQVVVE